MNKEMIRPDNVNHPNHYAGQGKVECIDFIASMVNQYPGILAGDLQNVCKYTWRSHNKNGKEDIKKAEWYFNHAEKTWNELMPEVQKQVQAFTRYPLFEIPNRMTVIQKGMEEVTASMGKDEAELYQRVMAGVNHFTDDYLRERAKAALKDWTRSYEKMVVQEVKPGEERPTQQKRVSGIHRVRSNETMER